ncbi:MAG: cell division protein CrgA [Microthrixaceae bacterium]
MAKAAKRRIDGTKDGTTGATDSSGSSGGTTSSKRVTPPKAQQGATAATRYTPPRTGAAHRPSPRWVPVLMFALWGLGLLVIILNYMQVLPGAGDGGNGWYLVGGLVAILAGIVVATQYH